jgi:hypothetical protein
MKLYDFAVYCEEQRDHDGNVIDEATIVVQPQTILASDERRAAMVAARLIPDEYMDGKLDRVQVVVRPFS